MIPYSPLRQAAAEDAYVAMVAQQKVELAMALGEIENVRTEQDELNEQNSQELLDLIPEAERMEQMIENAAAEKAEHMARLLDGFKIFLINEKKKHKVEMEQMQRRLDQLGRDVHQ